jgi:phage terminase Nu1 subunit (DNA packaging protein)
MLSLDKEQTRLTAAKADNEEMTAAERRATLLPLDVYESEMAKLAQIVKMKFLNLPSRLAPKIEGLSRNETKALLTAAVKDTLLELARYSNVADRASIAASPDAAPKRARARARSKPRKRKR